MAHRKASNRRKLILTSAIMSLIMSFIISIVLTLIHEGFGMHALRSVPLAWLQSYAVALPVSIILLPRIQRFVARLD